MVNQRMLGLGTARSVIRELFEYGKIRAAQVGAENVFDFSLGNPSVPCPQEVNDTAVRILREQPEVIHCYTRSEEHTSNSSHTVNSYAVFCLKKKKK